MNDEEGQVLNSCMRNNNGRVYLTSSLINFANPLPMLLFKVSPELSTIRSLIAVTCNINIVVTLKLSKELSEDYTLHKALPFAPQFQYYNIYLPIPCVSWLLDSVVGSYYVARVVLAKKLPCHAMKNHYHRQ